MPNEIGFEVFFYISNLDSVYQNQMNANRNVDNIDDELSHLYAAHAFSRNVKYYVNLQIMSVKCEWRHFRKLFTNTI